MVLFSFFLIVSHRNLISIYNNKKLEDDVADVRISGWIDTQKVSDSMDLVRMLMIKKRKKSIEETLTQKLLKVAKIDTGRRNSVKINIGGETSSEIVTMFDRYELVCLNGTNKVSYFCVEEGADNSHRFIKTEEQTLKRRVVKAYNDTTHNVGVVLLTDDGDTSNEDFYLARKTGSLLY